MRDRAITLIHELFELTQSEAVAEAEGLLSVFAAHGTDAPSWESVENSIRKTLGGRLRWRSEKDKQEEMRRQKASASSYNDHINRSRPSWQKKW
jgi:hypothetical protein